MLKRKLILLLVMLIAPGLLLIPLGLAQEEVIALSCYATLVEGAVPGGAYRVSCPSDCELRTTWGSGTYTTGAYICTSAAHAGLITLEEGGEFIIVFLGGQEEFISTEQNGITSNPYIGWDLAFAFSEEIGCNANASQMEGDIGTREIVTCSAGCGANFVWGTDIYRDDSTLCSAAAHAGLITLEEGGTFIVTKEEGQETYTGSEANGIRSADWGESTFSFSLSAHDNVLMTCNSSAFYFEGEVGDSYTMTCPANCEADYIWGTDVYAEDSKVCTAAAHAGVISLEEGGTFTLTFEEGQDNYIASERNGITSFATGMTPRAFSISGE